MQKILCVGDSTTWGIGSTLFSTFPNTGSWPTRLSSLLNSYHAPSQIGLGVPNTYGTDNRWTLGAGWANYNLGWGGDGSTNGASFVSSTGGTLTYTPGSTQGTYDKFDMYYLPATGNGTVTATATGGSAVVQSTNAANGVAKVTVTAASAGTGNALAMVNSAGATWITGVEPWLSTASKIRVANAGVTASTTSQWTIDATWGGVPHIKLYAPDLTIISLGINDAGSAVATSTVIANLKTLITATQVSGDVIVMSFPPSGPTSSAWTNYQVYEPLYPDAYAKMCQSLNLPYIDWWNRWGGTLSIGIYLF